MTHFVGEVIKSVYEKQLRLTNLFAIYKAVIGHRSSKNFLSCDCTIALKHVEARLFSNVKILHKIPSLHEPNTPFFNPPALADFLLKVIIVEQGLEN